MNKQEWLQLLLYLFNVFYKINSNHEIMLKQPLLKVSANTELNTKNFVGALMLTIIFFATISFDK